MISMELALQRYRSGEVSLTEAADLANVYPYEFIRHMTDSVEMASFLNK